MRCDGQTIQAGQQPGPRREPGCPCRRADRPQGAARMCTSHHAHSSAFIHAYGLAAGHAAALRDEHSATHILCEDVVVGRAPLPAPCVRLKARCADELQRGAGRCWRAQSMHSASCVRTGGWYGGGPKQAQQVDHATACRTCGPSPPCCSSRRGCLRGRPAPPPQCPPAAFPPAEWVRPEAGGQGRISFTKCAAFAARPVPASRAGRTGKQNTRGAPHLGCPVVKLLPVDQCAFLSLKQPLVLVRPRARPPQPRRPRRGGRCHVHTPWRCCRCRWRPFGGRWRQALAAVQAVGPLAKLAAAAGPRLASGFGRLDRAQLQARRQLRAATLVTCKHASPMRPTSAAAPACASPSKAV